MVNVTQWLTCKRINEYDLYVTVKVIQFGIDTNRLLIYDFL